jgi:uncharacterized repeat protein (TIGR04138 family)
MDSDEQQQEGQKPIEEVIADDGRYRMEAFGFLHEALGRSVREHHPDPDDPDKHVTGQQLCDSIVQLARERWGMMAPAVLKYWNVQASIDFGNMVYLMIEHNYMRKTEEDSVEDFRDRFDVDKDFDISSEIRLQD